MKILLNLLLVLSVGLPLAVNAAEAKFQPLLLVHGGAGDIAVEAIPNRKIGVKQAARAGYETLLSTGSVLDAVQAAVEVLELDPQFNAALGSALTWDETVEMDAAIMDGRDLNGGCVSVAKDIYHPIKLAREIMEKTPHRYLAGDGAMKFAIEQGFDILPEGTLVTERSLKALNDYKNSLSNSSRSANEKVTHGSPGTVGAVAIDEFGNIAAATSTGGITGKLPGRIGDSPILGGGTYADNAAAGLSATGHGETVMRFNLASRILALIEHRNMSAQEATVLMLDEMTKRFDETAGVISVDKNGEVGIYFTSKRMSWAYQRGNELHFGVDKDEDEIEIIGKPRTYDFY